MAEHTFDAAPSPGEATHWWHLRLDTIFSEAARRELGIKDCMLGLVKRPAFPGSDVDPEDTVPMSKDEQLALLDLAWRAGEITFDEWCDRGVEVMHS